MTDVEQGHIPAWPFAGDGAELLTMMPGVVLPALLDALDVAVIVGDARGRLVTYNDTAGAWHGRSAGSLQHVRGLAPEERSAEFGLFDVDGVGHLPAERLPLLRTLAEGGVDGGEMLLAPAGQPSRLVRWRGRVLHDAGGRVVGALVLLTDVTSVRTAERQLRAAHDALARGAQSLAVSEERFRSVFHHGPQAMCAVDAAGMISRVNPALRRLMAIPSDRLLGEQLEALVLAADRNRFAVALAASGGAELPAEPIEVRLQRSDGRPVWCEVGTTRVTDGAVQVLVSFADIDGRKHREAQLERRAGHDATTGLTTRTALAVVLTELLAPRADEAGSLTLLHVRLDGMPEVGAAPDSELLVEISRRLRGTVRPQDVLSRVGADEFVVLCQDLDGPVTRGSRALVRRLHRVLSAPMVLSSGPTAVAAAITVTQAVPGDEATAVLARADGGTLALARSRQAALSSVPLSSPRPPAPARLAELVDTATAEDRLRVVYQPVVDLRTGALVGAEALLRMLDRTGQVVMPDAFIPLAEASGAIHAMGDWVLMRSCRQVARWKARLPPHAEFALGVNLSPRQLDDPRLLDRVEAALGDSGLDPAALVLELTERLLTTGTARVRAQLEAVRRLGAHLAADDFGTGYCSIRYLVDLPLDVIKIDRSWTTRLGEDSPSGRLADGVVQLALSTGLVTIVEGIETELERGAALACGLVLAQGFLFAEPLAAAELEARLFAG